VEGHLAHAKGLGLAETKTAGETAVGGGLSRRLAEDGVVALQHGHHGLTRANLSKVNAKRQFQRVLRPRSVLAQVYTAEQESRMTRAGAKAVERGAISTELLSRSISQSIA
jgi:hypothetical protein